MESATGYEGHTGSSGPELSPRGVCQDTVPQGGPKRGISLQMVNCGNSGEFKEGESVQGHGHSQETNAKYCSLTGRQFTPRPPLAVMYLQGLGPPESCASQVSTVCGHLAPPGYSTHSPGGRV